MKACSIANNFKTDRQEWLDSLKGIAILGVVMVHCNNVSGLPGFLGSVARSGANGVQLFFVISSYLAMVSYNRYSKKMDGYSVKTALKWIVSRICKLMPLYYIAIIFNTFATGGSSYWLGSQLKITAGNFVAHLLFLHGLFPHYMDSIIGVEWYIGVLVFVYAIIPFVNKWIDNAETALVVWSLCAVASWRICMEADSVFSSRFIDSYIASTYFTNFNLIAQLPAILIGVLFYYVVGSGGG